MTESTLTISLDFIAQVTLLTQRIEDMLDWIWSQANTIVKDDGDKHILIKESSSLNNQKWFTKNTPQWRWSHTTISEGKIMTFLSETHIDMSFYESSINIDML